MAQKYHLYSQNIIPFYIVEQRLKQNFTSITNFINAQLLDNAHTVKEIAAIRADNTDFKVHIDKKLVELEKKITADIGRQLDGRIIVAINKNMASFAARMEDKEKEIGGLSTTITLKMEEMKKKILFQSAKEQQKAMAKETEQIEKKMKQTIEQAIKRNNSNTHSVVRPSSRDKHPSKVSSAIRQEQNGSSHQSHFNEEWVLRIKQAESKIAKLEDFIVSFDKRFYDNMTALKQNWKEFGEDVLETKKKLTSKQDQLRLQIAKVRVIREFEGAPEEVQQSFKSKLMLKFTDIYQLLGQLVTRTDLESEVERIKKTFNRHDGQLMDLREEMGKNSDYFTFYINNSNTQDLSSQIKQLKENFELKLAKHAQKIYNQNEKHEGFNKEIVSLEERLNSVLTKQGASESSIARLRQDLFKEISRIDALQQHNNFTPQKLAKIHNTLDINFSPNEQQLLTKKESQFTYNAAMKEMRSEMSKMKDQLFLVTHQLQELEKVRKAISGIEGKIDKIKVDSEEAILARKPWFCLSCDKNQKEKQQSQRLRKQASRKKLQEGKAALFSKEKSDKLIKLVPTGQQKFQVYQKYREKYLSDSIRLPDIYKEKIGDKEPALL